MDSQLIAGYGFALADEAQMEKHNMGPPAVGSAEKSTSEPKSNEQDHISSEKEGSDVQETVHSPPNYVDVDEFDYNVSDEDRANLRRVPAPMPVTAFLVAVCELAERFSYYGTTQVFQNFIQQPLPPGQPTGSNPDPNGVAGALGRGQQTATG